MSWLKKDSGSSEQRSESAAQASQAAAQAPTERGRTAKKGRPTPKRREAQARSVHPVVPSDRKAAKKEERRKRDEAWARQRQAMITGDDRYLPARDKGPIRRYMRDYVDARYSVGELFLPSTILLLLLVIGFSAVSRSQAAAMGSFWLMIVIYGLFFLAIIDAVVAWVRLRARLYAKFGQDKVRAQRGNFWYVFSRCFNLRRWRQPAPQVARRHFPS